MTKIFLITALFLGLSSNAQKFNKEELNLIKSGTNSQSMRVLQVTEPKDLEVLKNTSRPISPKDKNLRLLADRMLITVKEERGVGIAAPQVGLNVQAIWVKRFDKVNKPFEFFVNPKIEWQSTTLQLGAEGCLSIPNERGEVYRSLVIDLSYETLDGEKKKRNDRGLYSGDFPARV